MKEGYRLLGDFIRQVDVRNTDGKEENLLGVSVQKMFIPSIANTVGTDFTKYKVVKRGQFTYIPDTSRRGDKIGIALLTDCDEGLVSNIYTVFEVKDENELLPEYLMLWFSRPEFDRYARFKSHGSVREIMDWDEMCKVELPVPSIDKQRSIVKAYKTITERIELKRRINDNLSTVLSAVFDSLYQTVDDNAALPFRELCSLASSKRVFADDYVVTGVPFYRGKEITQRRNGEPISDPLFISNEHYELLKKSYGVPTCGDILITAVGTIGNSYLVENAGFYFKDGNIIWLKDFRKSGINYYIYDYMQTSLFKRELDGICIGSTQTALTIAALSNLKLKVPPELALKAYVNKSRKIRSAIQSNNAEIMRLTLVAEVILRSLSR